MNLRLLSIISFSCFLFTATTSWADKTATSDAARNGHFVFQIGAFDAYQGRSQNVGIAGLVGDHFSVTHHDDQNVMFGAGYLFNGFTRDRYSFFYGVNAFYLAPTRVKGNVTQEDLFTNLAYKYSITNIPVYLAGRALIDMSNPYYALTVDGGLGVNFVQTCDFSEKSLDGGVTIPDRAFSGNTRTQFSAMFGVGLQINDVLRCSPIEIDYRFFYLGEGTLSKNPQVLNDLKTGNSFANALIISVSI